jgi:hypothetical protein
MYVRLVNFRSPVGKGLEKFGYSTKILKWIVDRFWKRSMEDAVLAAAMCEPFIYFLDHVCAGQQVNRVFPPSVPRGDFKFPPVWSPRTWGCCRSSNGFSAALPARRNPNRDGRFCSIERSLVTNRLQIPFGICRSLFPVRSTMHDTFHSVPSRFTAIVPREYLVG